MAVSPQISKLGHRWENNLTMPWIGLVTSYHGWPIHLDLDEQTIFLFLFFQ